MGFVEEVELEFGRELTLASRKGAKFYHAVIMCSAGRSGLAPTSSQRDCLLFCSGAAMIQDVTTFSELQRKLVLPISML